MADHQTIEAGSTGLRAFSLVAKASGSPITGGTVNYYLKALTGANAGKWWKLADGTWAASETANAMTHQSDGHWTRDPVYSGTSPFADGVEYLEYAKESGDLHIPSARKLIGAYTPSADSSRRVDLGLWKGSAPAALADTDKVSVYVGHKGVLNDLAAGAAMTLTSAYDAAKTAAQAATALTNATWTDARAGKLDNLDAAVTSRLADADYTAPLDAAGTRAALGMAAADLDDQLGAIGSAVVSVGVAVAALPSASTIAGAVWSSGARTLTSFGTLVADVWAYATRRVSDATNITSTGGTTIPQTGDAYARLGAPAGASHAADVAAVKGDTAAVKLKTDNLPSDPADASDVAAATTAIYNRIGAPAGASLAADVAAVKADAASLLTNLATLAAKFTGITLLAHWLGAIAGKQAANATAQTEIRASGAGSGSYDPTTDSLEALRDRDVAASQYLLVGGFARNGTTYHWVASLLKDGIAQTSGLSALAVVGVTGNTGNTDLGYTEVTAPTIGTGGRCYGSFTLTTAPTAGRPAVLELTVVHGGNTIRGRFGAAGASAS